MHTCGKRIAPLKRDDKIRTGMSNKSSVVMLCLSVLMLFIVKNIGCIVDRGFFRSLLVYEMSWRRSNIVPQLDNSSSSMNIFQPRAEFSSIPYKGRIYIIAGASDKQFYNDVWMMDFNNPNKFNLVTLGGKKAKNIFSPRYSHQAILHQNEIYVMGPPFCGILYY